MTAAVDLLNKYNQAHSVKVAKMILSNDYQIQDKPGLKLHRRAVPAGGGGGGAPAVNTYSIVDNAGPPGSGRYRGIGSRVTANAP